MQDNNPIRTIDHINIDEQLKAGQKKILIRIGVSIIFNTIMAPIFIKGPDFSSVLLDSLIINLFSANIAGFILGTIVAIFPYKKLNYKKKYLRASLLTILFFQIYIAIGIILVGLMPFLSCKN